MVGQVNSGTARSERGVAIVTTLFFILIISILLMGVGTYAVSHQQRAHMDLTYAQAMDLAEAGVNYEFQKITANPATADKQDAKYTTSLGPGTFTVWTTASDGVSNWKTGDRNLLVWGTGTVNGTTRTIRVSAKGYSGSGKYAVFALNTGMLNGSAMNINGDVGTNGTLNFNGHPGITGQVSFNGADSDWQGADPGGYSTQSNPDPITWPTVDSLAQTAFGAQGLAYAASHNDNALCSQIRANRITANGSATVTLVGKAGGANYYLTQMTFNGNAKLVCNNAEGPITIWMGPSGGAGSCTINGGVATVSMSSNPNNGVKLYCGTSTGVTLNGNCNFDGLIYAYNTSGGRTIGQITNNGTPTVNGSILAPTVTLNGNPTINYVPGYLNSGGVGYYGFDNLWQEINPR